MPCLLVATCRGATTAHGVSLTWAGLGFWSPTPTQTSRRSALDGESQRRREGEKRRKLRKRAEKRRIRGGDARALVVGMASGPAGDEKTEQRLQQTGEAHKAVLLLLAGMAPLRARLLLQPAGRELVQREPE